MANLQSAKKQNRPVVEEDEQMKDQENSVMEVYRAVGSQQVWKQYFKFQGRNGGLKAFVPMKPTLMTEHNHFPLFQSADRLAEWVYNTAKRRPMQLNLCCGERSGEVRDALLRQFHRWSEAKISRAVEQYQKLGQEAEDQCQNQVMLYIEELRGKLMAGAKALFWLNVLQPMIHPAPIPRQEIREVLLVLLEELKSVEGLYEQLMTKSECTWDVLTLPLKLEPLFHGVSTLALCGQEVAANEAMQLLTMFAEQNAAVYKQKTATPIGLSIIASVSILAPMEISSLRELPGAFCERFSQPFFMLIGDWCVVVNEVLDILGKSLASRWASCERSSFEEAFKNTVEHDLQSDFARLRHALATDQLYAMRKAGGVRSSTDEECLDVSILRSRGLLHVQLNGGDKWM